MSPTTIMRFSRICDLALVRRMAENFRDFFGVIQSLRKGLQTFPRSNRTGAMIDVFGQRDTPKRLSDRIITISGQAVGVLCPLKKTSVP